jgi:uncharacterized protein
MCIENPCIRCGACCAFFRVSFYWEETSAADSEGIPVELTEKVSDFLQCMQGTNQPHPRCIALQGTIGENVTCQIYNKRSSTCRDFGLHDKDGKLFMDGENLIRCNEARKAWNLPPLTRAELHDLMHFLPVRQAFVPRHNYHNPRFPHHLQH